MSIIGSFSHFYKNRLFFRCSDQNNIQIHHVGARRACEQQVAQGFEERIGIIMRQMTTDVQPCAGGARRGGVIGKGAGGVRGSVGTVRAGCQEHDRLLVGDG
jgi:hypothetical protein